MLSLVTGQQIFAQTKYEENTVSLLGNKGELVKNAELVVTDSLLLTPARKSTVLSTSEMINIITFAYNEPEQFSTATGALPDTFSVVLKATIYYTPANSTQEGTIANRAFTLTYSKNNAYNKNDIFYFNDAHKVRIVVTDITAKGIDPATALRFLMLSADIRINRNYAMNCAGCDVTAISGNVMNDELAVSWGISKSAAEYDLEWAFVSADMLSRYTGAPDYPANIFRNNATRVTVTDTRYRIPLLYDNDGTVFCRVRGAQKMSSGERQTTRWSSDFGGAGLGQAVIRNHEPLLNWQASTSFAEEGKRKSVVQYYDGTLRNRQTVTKDNTTNTTIVGATYYDKQGRPAIQVLPAPTVNNVIGFTPGFNRNNINSAVYYDASQYDTLINPADYCATGARPMNVSAGTSNYYSPQNPDVNNGFNKYIPDAEGYPFSEIKYVQDNTGRIAAQGGAGPVFQLGGGKETKYYYGPASQSDLDALFGTEAGDASHYRKNMVRDANGQYSVSYVDMKGRTVATALAGSAPASLATLASYRDSLQTDILISPTNNIISGSDIVAAQGLLVPQRGTYTFHYSVDPQSMLLDNCNKQPVCYDCLYDLNITITDDCNNQHMPDKKPVTIEKHNFSLNNITSGCGQSGGKIDTTFSVFLEEGSYSVAKRLSISRYGMDYMQDSIYMKNNLCLSFEDFYRQQMALVKKELTNCKKDTVQKKSYENYRDMMLQQMTPPFGLYARHTPGFTDPNSVIDNNRFLHLSSIFRRIYYYDDNNKLDIINDSISKYRFNGPGVAAFKDYFSDNFKDSWANTLLYVHPEKGILDRWEAISDSHNWDEQMDNISTFQEAVQKGFLNPLAMTEAPASNFSANNPDPYFKRFPSQVAVMKDIMLRYRKVRQLIFSAVYINMWAFSNTMVKCGTGGALDATCEKQFETAGNVFNTTLLCTPELDQAWNYFKTAYLQEKRQVVEQGYLFAGGMPAVPDELSRVFKNSKNIIAANIDNSLLNATDTNLVKQKVQQQVDAMVNTNCINYASYWWNKLSACGFVQSTDSAAIINRLISVCKEGGDATHPFGASSVKPGSTSVWKNFDDAIRDYVNTVKGGNPDAVICNGFLIDVPAAYNQPLGTGNAQVSGKPTACECDNITQKYNRYLQLQASYGSFSNYMLRVYNTTISNGALDTLRGLCAGNQCQQLTQPILLPPVLQCGGTTTACTTCDTVMAAYSTFNVKYPGITPVPETWDNESQTAKNNLFVKFMNMKTGQQQTVDAYLTFIQQCKAAQGSTSSTRSIMKKVIGGCIAYADSLTFPSSGVTKPGQVDCAKLQHVYELYQNAFPQHNKGATVKMFIPAVKPLAARMATVASSVHTFPDTTTVTDPQTGEQLTTVHDAMGKVTVFPQPGSGSTPAPTNTTVATMSATALAVAPPPTPTGTWVDTTLDAKQLFEWWFTSQLGLQGQGYTYLNYADWLINSCGYKLHQLPWSTDTVYADKSALQQIWNQFNNKYPASQSTISETIDIGGSNQPPVLSFVDVFQGYNQTQWVNGYVYDKWDVGHFPGPVMERAANGSLNGVPGLTIEERSYLPVKMGLLPLNASITSATYSLYDWQGVSCNPGGSTGNCSFGSAHYRNINDNPHAQISMAGGFFIPGVNNLLQAPSQLGTATVVIPTVTDGIVCCSTTTFISAQDFTSLDATALVQSAYNNVSAVKVNYPFAFAVIEGDLHKDGRYAFSNRLNVSYTAARCDVFTAFVNNVLGTSLNVTEIKDLYKYHAALSINDNCNDAPAYTGSPADNSCSTSTPCSTVPDILNVPAAGVVMPATINCALLSETYKNFIADFPGHLNGATFKIYLPGGGGAAALSARALSTAPVQEATPLPDTAMINHKAARMLAPAAGSTIISGQWVDTTMNAKQLFEWYFAQYLGSGGNGYTYANYADWLVNGCGYKLNQLPWSDTVYVRQDTLQNIWNRFIQRYPAGNNIISEPVNVPMYKLLHTYFGNDGNVDVTGRPDPTYPYLEAGTWTSGYWYTERSSFHLDLNVIPGNANITAAQLSLSAMMYPWSNGAAHFRYAANMNVNGVLSGVTGLYIPSSTVWVSQPFHDGAPQGIIPTVTQIANIGSSGDFYSNQDFPGLDMLAMLKPHYDAVHASAVNYPFVLDLNDESNAYKRYTFGGVGSSLPVGKGATLVVNYTAARCDVFTTFVNNALGTQLGLVAIKSLFSSKGRLDIDNNCATATPGTPCVSKSVYPDTLLLCSFARPSFETITDVQPDPCKDSISLAYAAASEIFRHYKDSLVGNFADSYSRKCLSAGAYEQFAVLHPVSEYHYTLYYYNQSGNLIKTVPPAGVQPNRNKAWLDQVAQKRAAGQLQAPAHTMATIYRYNSLNNIVSQYTPDAGTSSFWYDRLGRLAVSRNAEQLKSNKYSYTAYDVMGRITEVGEKEQPNQITNTISANPVSLNSWINYANNRYPQQQVTRTVYDVASPTINSLYNEFNQKAYALRNRVSYAQYFAQLQYGGFVNGIYIPTYLNYDYGIYYSYDVHGNVDTLLHHYRTGAMSQNGYNQFKLVAYGYDLISGKVNLVSYQPGKADALYHRYEYDAVNRLTDVYISTRSAYIGDKNVEEHESRYTYYKHGSLARQETGQNRVQGLDYAYTLQGWMKGVNSTALNPAFDMNGDGAGLASRDAFGYSLSYYMGDYKAINAGVQPFASAGGYLGSTVYKDLFNGNISSMHVSIKGLQTQLYNYRYDQLNRLVSMDAYKGFDSLRNNWSAITPTNAYSERIVYDANGNIQTYRRDGRADKPAMDQLTYQYRNGTNLLDYVKDAVGDAAYSEDIDNQAPGNYTYDAIGNLIKDFKEGINNIEWTLYGKIKKITKADGSTIAYTYDVAGNRISKEVRTKGKSVFTWYARDAQGNTLSVYQLDNNGNRVTLNEQYVYGSSRLGTINRNAILNNNVSLPSQYLGKLGATYSDQQLRGTRQYEMNNHLGNVLLTVSDKKFFANNGYDADIMSASDYAPFGMTLVGRSYSKEGYRYGFNGKEKSDEVYGQGNVYDYGFRIYNPRLGRFLSIDPLQKKYPELTPYQFASNTPIRAVDLDGLEGVQYLEAHTDKKGKTTMKRVVEVDVYVAISRNEKSVHFYSKTPADDADVKKSVESDLKQEFKDDKFKDAEGHDVVWKFNVTTFQVDDKGTIDSKHKTLAGDDKFAKLNEAGKTEYRGVIVQRQHISEQVVPAEPTNLPVTEDGYFEHGFNISVNDQYYSARNQKSHTLAHEVTHFFLRLHPLKEVRDPDNTPAGHAGAGGGILNYGTAVFSFPGQIKSSPDQKTTVSFDGLKGVTQTNVSDILQSVPQRPAPAVDPAAAAAAGAAAGAVHP
ncbi:RHS repeat-associated protein [Chitinophaga niastensis]|uniref:RHS repeat-associated protein n=2 Tax=Chitinophaga niastensis TaxID=536980 RepID=A0A2P8HJE5_CHINA|nr:RHS repeat-associated protein [Chitinophaga niastensis]